MKEAVNPDSIDFDSAMSVVESSRSATVYLRSLKNSGQLIEIGVLHFDGSFDCWLNPAPWSILSELRSRANQFRINFEATKISPMV